jgi:hypothetical protein
MRISFRMIILSLVLFLSEACVNLDAANNRNQYLENDDSEDNEISQDLALHTISSKWLENPENT